MNRPSRRHRTGLKDAVRAAALVAAVMVLAGLAGCSKASHYRAHHDTESLAAVLYEEVKPGDTLDHIQELLGPGLPPQDREKLFAGARDLARKFPREYPGGVRTNDQWLGYPYGNGMVYLQFRDRRLINFEPAKFANVPGTVSP